MWRIFGLIFFDDKDHFVDIEKKKFRKTTSNRLSREKAIAVSDTVAVANRLNGNAFGLNPRSRRAIKSGRNASIKFLLSYSGDHRTKGNRHIYFQIQVHRFYGSEGSSIFFTITPPPQFLSYALHLPRLSQASNRKSGNMYRTIFQNFEQ